MKNLPRKIGTILLILIMSCSFLTAAQNAPEFDNGEDPKPSGKIWTPVDILTDEFNQTNGIDTSKWDDLHPHWSGRAPSAFKRANTTVSGGYLRLKSTLRRDPSTVNDPLNDIWVDAASCVSKGWTAKPGYYYEAHIKASSLSMTSSFWFRVGNFSEIDIIEHIGNPSRADRQDDLPFEFNSNTHYYGPHAGLSPKKNVWRMPVRGRDGFHTYGLYWTPNLLTFYWDGEEVMSTVPRVPFDENLKMIFDTEVFAFATAGIPNIGLPTVANLNNDNMNTMLVDWVRVWELADAPNPPSNQRFHIQNRASGKYIRPQSNVNGGVIAHSPNTWTGTWAQWEMIPSSGDYFYLKNVQTGKYIRPTTNGSTDDGSPLELTPSTNTGDRTQWRQVNTSNGYFYLQNRWTGQYFRPNSNDDLSSANGSNFNVVQRPTSYSGNWTQWRFVNVGTAKTTDSKIDDGAFDFYPNPASKSLNFKTGKYDYNVSIYDISGRNVMTLNLEKNALKEVSISNLNAGMYLVRYHTNNDNTTFTKKLVIR